MKCLSWKLVTAVILLLAAGPAFADWTTVYSTDFSSDPGWTVDPTDPNPNHSDLQWDSATNTFHGHQVNWQGTYAYVPITGFDSSQSWRLQFDTKMNSCGWSSGWTFGLFDSGLQYPWGPTTNMSAVDSGYGVALTISSNSQASYSPFWSTGTWYHNVMAYDAVSQLLTLDSVDRVTGNSLASLSISVALPADRTNLGLSLKHVKNASSGVSSDATVDYNLDNVRLEVRSATPSVPAPGAMALGTLGLALVGWTRRRIAH